MEPGKKFNFLTADCFADEFHGAHAAGALERIAAPCLQDELTAEGAHVADGLLRRRGDEEDLEVALGGVVALPSSSPSPLHT